MIIGALRFFHMNKARFQIPARVIYLAVLFALAVLTPRAGAASLTLHQLFSSHMVLQRDASDPIWGWAPVGATVTVTVRDQNSAIIQTGTAVAGSNGSWQVQVGPFGLVANNAAYSITISCPGQTTVTLTDVLIGDVWLCTGQSNMAYSLNVIGVTNLTAEIADSANYPSIRNFAVPNVSAGTPQTNIPSGSWQVAGPSTTGNFTAAGYFTAREIYKEQHIPIGILCSAWPGSEIDSWLDPQFIAGLSDYTQPLFDQELQTSGRDTLSGPYNAMIAPLAPFSIKAVEWYQGEYNVSWPEQYSRLLPGLMSKWRSLFGQPNLPFIIIQLPNFGGIQTQPVETGSWAELREAQAKTVLNDPYARLVTTIDVGNGDLHPIDKQDVGVRAAWAAADLVYGQNLVSQAPIMTNVSVSGSSIICTFDHVGGGLMTGSKSLNPLSPAQFVSGGTLGNFAICGANKNYFAARATITASNQVTVSSASVAAPVAVRYAWGNNPPCDLYAEMTDGNGNVTNGLPAGSQRSDPVNLLNVNIGTGTGYYPLGQQVTVTASNLAAETFDHWSGDTNLLSGARATTVIATQAQEYVSVLANYRITSALSGVSAVGLPSQISVSWNPLVAVHYYVLRSTTNGGPYTPVGIDVVGTSNFIDNAVIPGTNYYYVVAATNLMGQGPISAQVTAIAINGPPITTNIWDANGVTIPNPVDGSGSWLVGSNWWNGATNVSGHWVSGSALDSASFGAGTAGSYLINLAGGAVYASNLFFTTSGYILTNGMVNLLGASAPITVNANVTGTLRSGVTTTVGGISLKANPGAVLSLAGGASFAGNILFTGGGSVDFNAGTFSGGNFALWAQTPLTQEAATVNAVRLMIGYGGNSTYTMNSPGAVATSTGGGGDSFIGRAGSIGVWDLQQGTITLTAVSGDNLRVGYDSNSKGTLLVEGGTLNLGGNVLSVNYGAASSGSGTVNISGGNIIASSIQFGGNGAFASGSTAVLNMTGGAVYLSSGGIANVSSGSLALSASLSGGTLVASSPWSLAVPVTLTTTNGNIHFQCADSNSNPHDITISGNLSGIGGLTKTGGGMLALTGANTYAGGTTVTAGILSLTTTNNLLMAYTNNGAALTVRVGKAGSSLLASTAAFNGASSATFDLAGLGATTAPVLSAGSVVMNGNVTVSVSNAPTSGSSVLFSYSSARSGSGNFVAGIVPAGGAIVDDTIGRRVTLTFPPPGPPVISSVAYSAGTVMFFGSNGPALQTCRMLCATNVGTALGAWVPIQTNSFDAAGDVSNGIPIDSGNPAMFFRLVTP